MARSAHIYTNASITANGTRTGTAIDVPVGTKSIAMESILVVGGAGGTEKVYLQTTFDGSTWIDISQHAHTTSTASKVSNVVTQSAVTAAAVTDGTLGDNTNQSVIGTQVRVKEISAGTAYTATTTLDVYVKFND